MIDNRANNGLLGKYGNDILQAVENEVGKIDDSVLFYKIETENGNLVGYFSLKTDVENELLVANKFQKEIRPAFKDNSQEIDTFIEDFINSKDWTNDILQTIN